MVKISCVCPTYGRAWCIGEAIESYIRQEPCGFETELFILNDCVDQPLICDAPGVRIINTPAEIPDVCRKFDLAVKHAAGEWICWWEDDDISLPHRLRMSVERGVSIGRAYRQVSAWRWNKGNLSFLSAPPIGAAIFPKAAYETTGGARGPDGYPDQNMIANIPKLAGMDSEDASPADAFFVYRWAGMGVHDSGFGRGRMADPATRFAAFKAATLADPRFVPGAQVIRPAWNEDYALGCRNAAGGIGG